MEELQFALLNTIAMIRYDLGIFRSKVIVFPEPEVICTGDHPAFLHACEEASVTPPAAFALPEDTLGHFRPTMLNDPLFHYEEHKNKPVSALEDVLDM